MPNTEKNALGRVLLILKAVYISDEIENLVPLLDNLSATLSHINDEKQPIAKALPQLKREIKAADKAFYHLAERYFARIYPVLNYDFDKAVKHIPGIICGNDKICAKIVRGELDKAKSMKSAMKSYPGFLFGEFDALSDSQFYDLVFGFYPKIYEREEFMDEVRYLFDS